METTTDRGACRKGNGSSELVEYSMKIVLTTTTPTELANGRTETLRLPLLTAVAVAATCERLRRRNSGGSAGGEGKSSSSTIFVLFCSDLLLTYLHEPETGLSVVFLKE